MAPGSSYLDLYLIGCSLHRWTICSPHPRRTGPAEGPSGKTHVEEILLIRRDPGRRGMGHVTKRSSPRGSIAGTPPTPGRLRNHQCRSPELGRRSRSLPLHGTAVARRTACGQTVLGAGRHVRVRRRPAGKPQVWPSRPLQRTPHRSCRAPLRWRPWRRLPVVVGDARSGSRRRKRCSVKAVDLPR